MAYIQIPAFVLESLNTCNALGVDPELNVGKSGWFIRFTLIDHHIANQKKHTNHLNRRIRVYPVESRVFFTVLIAAADIKNSEGWEWRCIPYRGKGFNRSESKDNIAACIALAKKTCDATRQ